MALSPEQHVAACGSMWQRACQAHHYVGAPPSFVTRAVELICRAERVDPEAAMTPVVDDGNGNGNGNGILSFAHKSQPA